MQCPNTTASELTIINFQFSLIVIQQQHSSKLQLGHCPGDELILHSLGVQLQSKHLIVIGDQFIFNYL
jgi:hypothetical protein